MQVKVYSTPTCPYCIMVNDYLVKNKIDFTKYDVSSDKKALDEMIKLTGQMGVPVITVDKEVIIGFDKARLDQLLKK